MLNKFIRQSNSQKYSNSTHQQQQYFSMSLADMDIGQYQPLQTSILSNFQQYLQQCLANVSDKKVLKDIDKKLKNQAKIAIIQWYNNQYQCKLHLVQYIVVSDNNNQKQNSIITKTCVEFIPSAVTAISYCILAYSKPGSKVLIFTPVYAAYINQISALNRKIQACELQIKQVNNNQYKDVKFYINFTDFEQKLKNGVDVVIVCHPHNPAGRIWNSQQVQTIVKLCKKLNVTIVSDEILADLCLNNNKFCSFANHFSMYNKIVVINSISKSFNSSSIQGAYFLTPIQNIHPYSNTMMPIFNQKIDPLALCTIKSCLTLSLSSSSISQQWLILCCNIINNNYRKLINWRNLVAPLLILHQLEAAYLIYLDFNLYFNNLKELREVLRHYRIQLLQLGGNYYPARTDCLQMRVCIACEEEHFDNFLMQLTKVINKLTKVNSNKQQINRITPRL